MAERLTPPPAASAKAPAGTQLGPDSTATGVGAEPRFGALAGRPAARQAGRPPLVSVVDWARAFSGMTAPLLGTTARWLQPFRPISIATRTCSETRSAGWSACRICSAKCGRWSGAGS